MNLDFQKQGDVYIARATLTEVAAIHVVRKDSGIFNILQSHVDDGNYAATAESTNRNFPKNVDFVIEEKIFPIYLEFVSHSEVESAQIIS